MRVFKKIHECGNSIGEMPQGISKTIPDMSMSIRTIIQRFAQGLTPPISQELMYSEDMPDIRGLDISQLYQMREMAKQNLEDVQIRMRQLEAEAMDKKRVEQEEKLRQLRIDLGLNTP